MVLEMNHSISFDLGGEKDKTLKLPKIHNLFLISYVQSVFQLINSAFILEVAFELWNYSVCVLIEAESMLLSLHTARSSHPQHCEGN